MNSSLRGQLAQIVPRQLIRDPSRLRFALLCILVVVCAVTGGSNRPTVPSLLILRPVLVVGVVAMMIIPGNWDWRCLRWLLVLAIGLVATMAIQLIPLPSSFWLTLPGHVRYHGVIALTGMGPRPISLVPDMTINAMLAVLPAFAVLISYAGMNSEDRLRTVWILLALCVSSALLGLLQLANGTGGATLYGRDDVDVVTGLFANRNHGALALALCLPVGAAATRRTIKAPLHAWLALISATSVILPLVLASGSRQGLVFTAIAFFAAIFILFKGRPVRGRLRQRYMVLAAAGVVAAILIGAVFSGRTTSLDRLTSVLNFAQEARLRNLPVVFAITRDFLPWGIGYGAFDPVFRGYEPDSFLHSSYFNHAHNDALELIMTGGVPASFVLVGFLIWCAARLWKVFRASGHGRSLAYAGAAVILLSLLASLVDYPLRTAIMTMAFTLSCCWIASDPAAQRRRTSAAWDD